MRDLFDQMRSLASRPRFPAIALGVAFILARPSATWSQEFIVNPDWKFTHRGDGKWEEIKNNRVVATYNEDIRTGIGINIVDPSREVTIHIRVGRADVISNARIQSKLKGVFHRPQLHRFKESPDSKVWLYVSYETKRDANGKPTHIVEYKNSEEFKFRILGKGGADDLNGNEQFTVAQDDKRGIQIMLFQFRAMRYRRVGEAEWKEWCERVTDKMQEQM